MSDQLDSLCTLVTYISDEVSKHDRAIIMIHEAIRLGINTGPAIITALHEVGFNKQYVGIWLHSATGDQPERHHWARNPDGTYRSHKPN